MQGRAIDKKEDSLEIFFTLYEVIKDKDLIYNYSISAVKCRGDKCTAWHAAQFSALQ